MSTIDNTIEKLDNLLTKLQISDSCLASELNEIKALLTDKTVLILEWNEEDIQKAAREKIANLHDIVVEKIIEKPLRREDVEWVISRLDKYYDCNYGITWETINSSLDDISLPDAESVIIKEKDYCEWVPDSPCASYYSTNCGNTVNFRYKRGSVAENEFVYCYFCGRKIKEK
ncbi:MAG TPA: hypothetical protein DCY00_07460 [Actinobacteria bacterium]|nr:hypothetical protein [Actinomycetota bacterium]